MKQVKNYCLNVGHDLIDYCTRFEAGFLNVRYQALEASLIHLKKELFLWQI